jgi:ParB-like chromosome segregation protein Spo0J
MRIERIPLTQLIDAPYNPRVALTPGDPRYEKLARSLREFELVQPLVWNARSGHVVGGHQRLAILRRDGVEAVECVVVDLSPDRERALNVALNNEHVGGAWDGEKLLSLLGELQATPDFDPTLTGFDERQLQDLLLAPRMEEAPPEEPAGPPEYTVTLEVRIEDWPAVSEQLDELLSRRPQVRVHVDSPQAG